MSSLFQARHLWDGIDAVLSRFSDLDGTARELPGCRDRWNRDWALEGYKLPASAVRHVRVQTARFNASIPHYPGEAHFRVRLLVVFVNIVDTILFSKPHILCVHGDGALGGFLVS